jgi:tetratricopeptide (TPR) repeat protein
MSGFLRKLFGQQQAPQSTDEESDLEKFYTDSEHARQVFDQLATSTNLPKRIMVIHGLGGVGKSTLLKVYVLTCRKHRIPAALVASEEAPSPVDVLAEWGADLNHDGITLPTFQKTLNHYRAIQAKVEAETKKSHQAASQIAGTMGKTVAKTAISMAASAIPVVGPFVGAVGGQSAEAFIDWLHGFLTKPDLDLYLDPAKRLDGDFLNDLTRAAARQRIVLMTDTYEQLTALDDWMRELARKLPKNVLLVLAGRTVPAWDRSWQDWMGKADIVELKEMTPDDIRTLVHRYYAHIRGGESDPQQVEAIVQFARGLPMVATTVVQLWVKYGLEDFLTVRPQVVADLVDRLLEGVPSDLRPAFESAAVLRYFNVEALSALLENGGAEALYAELRRWPFIRSRREGLAVHDAMREMINEALNVRTPARFHALHERAAAYYEAHMAKASGEERERYAAEQLYHRVRVDEVSGIQFFQQRAEDFTRYHLANRLRALLNDVNNYPLESVNSRLWREYYNARIAHLEGHFDLAQAIYQAIGENAQAEQKLQKYAMCDLANILRRRELLRQPGGQDKALRVAEASLPGNDAADMKLAMSWVYLSDIYTASSHWEKALLYLGPPRKFFNERNDYSGLLTVLEFERRIYWRQGNLRKVLDIEKELWNTFSAAGEPQYLRNRVPPEWGWAWGGTFSEREEAYRAAVAAIRSMEDHESLCIRTRDLGLCLVSEGKYDEGLALIEESLMLARSLGSLGELEVFIALAFHGIAYYKQGTMDRAEDYLSQAVALGQKLKAHLGAALLYFAATYEVLQNIAKAEDSYRLLQEESHRIGRNYYECGALTGLVRTTRAQHNYPAIRSLWAQAERLAEQYEYHDFFTSLYLTRGHLSWNGLIPEWESGFDAALHYYQLALIHALRFNRFMLDEVLSGREQGTPLRPIIQHCLERGKEGERMLVALRDWWQSGMNDIGTPRPDTMSPLAEGIALLEAEKVARQREPGDGSSQQSVVEQITMALP